MSNITIDIDHEKNTATITAAGVLSAEFYALLCGIMEVVPKHYSVEGFSPTPSTTEQVRIGYDGNTAPILQHPYCGDASCYLCKPIYLKEQEEKETRKPKRIRITGEATGWEVGEVLEIYGECENSYLVSEDEAVEKTDAEVIAWHEPARSIEALTVAHRGLTAITQTDDLEYAKRLAKQTLDEMRGIVEGGL